MTEIAPGSYSDGFKVLRNVAQTNLHLVISSLCESIIDGSQDSYCFKPVKDTLEQFSFGENPKIVRIGDYSFYNCRKLTKIDLSSCRYLTLIGSNAFCRCVLITNIILPEGLQNISRYAISETAITSINIPSTVTSIADYGISYCYSLKSITFSPGSQFQKMVFNNFIATGLTSFEVPQSVVSISGMAFSTVSTMNSVYVNSENKNFIDDNGKAIYTVDRQTIIYFASNIEGSYDIWPTVTKINDGCFVNSKLSHITIPDQVSTIGIYAFVCQNLKQIKLPSQITTIPYNCFLSAGLTSIEIPSIVVTISDFAFKGCSNLAYIYIPESVTYLGGSCLPSNNKLKVNISEKSKYSIDDQLLVLSKDKTNLIQFLGTRSDIVIPSTVTTIKQSAFENNKDLKSVSFDGTSELQTIESAVFRGCTGLTSFTFSPNIQSIGSYVFANCPLSMEINFPSTLISIGQEAFINTKLASVKFNSDNDLVIKDSAFKDCKFISQVLFLCEGSISLGMNCFGGLTSLRSIQIPNNVVSVGSSCFTGCSVERVGFDGNTISFGSISASMFKNCLNLNTFTIPSNCISLESECLRNTMIENLVIPDSLRNLNTQCLMGCSQLTSISITSNSNLEQIEYGVFEGCFKFSTVNRFESTYFMSESNAIYSRDRTQMYVYPPASPRIYFSLLDGVERIEDGAFLGCVNIEVITIPDGNIGYIGSNAFRGCIKLRQITLPSSIKRIGSDAFTNCPLLSCGIIIQNTTQSFINLLRDSGLNVKSQQYCSRFTCRAQPLSSPNIPISYITVFILI